MNIKLFVCCHRPFEVPKHPLLVPVQVGTALAAERFAGFCHDDEGENISAKNRSYCELTAQYWAWKNVEADYYGFFHYRRYLYPEADAKRPYRIEAQPKLSWLEKCGYGEFAKIIEKYDIIAPKGEDMHMPVREHYAAAPYHHGKDLELIAQIVRERHPEMATAMDDYLNGTACYFGNIYIMKKPTFDDYCGWLFPILEEFDRRADLSGYGQQELRVNGYLAERLFGVYYTYRRSALRCLELPRVHFEPDRRQRWKKKAVNCLLPAGSWRRAFVKKLGESIGVKEQAVEENDVMVSVIVLTYNHEKYICQALDSILMQEVDFKYEILIGDDASTDATAEMVRDYAHRHSEIVKATIREQNLGATRNLYDLQTRAQGKYLAYLEGDDYWCDRKKLTQQVSFMRSHDDYIACTHFCHVVAENGERLPKKSIPWIAKKQEYRLSDFQGLVLPGHISTLLHRNIFEYGDEDYRCLIECNPLIGDRSLMLLLAAKGAIYQIPEYMSCYRWRQGDNATTVAYEKNAECIIDDYLYTRRLEECAAALNIDGGFQAHYRDLFTGAVWRMICKPTRENWAIVKAIAKEGNLFVYITYLPVGIVKKVTNRWRER